ncbi:hypothetical protein AA650_02870 [Anabaena sp. WA102]|uniref:prepilin-type N-terminal cleavage/methylation domain-containing protein n=1 Tax=Anabaena sp. WA102 TaxID=1647413 RepID=UPI0006AC62F5|nr:prepilin-type N-terminal cleavage/methylation domain-containing protein [Anabaena sp. WA102]ALB39545.1 hypothetical protein AA650_02870 [Anabaena sp. WA102]
MLNNTFNIKKNIQFYLQNYKTIQFSLNGNEGFTLIELLVAIAIMSGVLIIAGIGIVAMLKQNSKALSESDRRANLNRALDYISNEVRMANSISVPATYTSPPEPSGAIGKLRLTIPSDTAFPNHEYYIVPTSANCSPPTYTSTTIWACDYIIYRRLIPSSGSSPSDSMLVDGVNSFTASVSSNRQVVLTLIGTLPPILTSSGKVPQQTDPVTTTAVTRAK